LLERKRVGIALFGPNSPVSAHIQCVNPMQIILIANPIYTTLTHACISSDKKSLKYQKMVYL